MQFHKKKISAPGAYVVLGGVATLLILALVLFLAKRPDETLQTAKTTQDATTLGLESVAATTIQEKQEQTTLLRSEKDQAVPSSDTENKQPEQPKKYSKNWPTFSQMSIGDFTSGEVNVSSSGQSGSVRVTCHISHFNYDDPVVTPNKPGAAHLHMFFGNSLTDAYSTTESLQTEGDGTCDGGPLNRTAYWVPALIDRDKNARIAQYVLVYYKSGPLHGSKINPIPEGLRMIAGNARASTVEDNDGSYKWYCGFPGNYPLNYGSGKLIPDCKPGDVITLSLVFPQCWDGKNLDSANHRDHMAYPTYEGSGAVCPATHPVAFPEITYNIFWNNKDQNTAGWYLSSDRHGGLDTEGGATTHGDWFGAWHPEILETLVNECNNKDHDCKGATISPNLRLTKTPTLGIGDGDDIFNENREPQKIPVADIAGTT